MTSSHANDLPWFVCSKHSSALVQIHELGSLRSSPIAVLESFLFNEKRFINARLLQTSREIQRLTNTYKSIMEMEPKFPFLSHFFQIFKNTKRSLIETLHCHAIFLSPSSEETGLSICVQTATVCDTSIIKRFSNSILFDRSLRNLLCFSTGSY